MRQYNGQTARPTPGDRAPISRGTSYASLGIAPHVITQRFLYTVPAAKKFSLGFATVEALRATAAAPVGQVAAQVRTTTLQPTTNYPAAVRTLDNTVGSAARISSAPTLVLVAGESVDGVTEDVSTGGTMNYLLSYQGTEYDA